MSEDNVLLRQELTHSPENKNYLFLDVHTS